jgi:hypothetical protein
MNSVVFVKNSKTNLWDCQIKWVRESADLEVASTKAIVDNTIANLLFNRRKHDLDY